MLLSRFDVIMLNISQIINYYALYCLIFDQYSSLILKIIFAVIYLAIKYQFVIQDLDYTSITTFIESLYNLDFNIFKLKFSKESLSNKHLNGIITLIPCIFEFFIEVHIRDNLNPFFIAAIILPLLIIGYLIHKSWLQSIDFNIMVVLTFILQKQFSLQIGLTLCFLFYIAELFLIIITYLMIFKLIQKEEIGRIIGGFIISCLLGACLVLQRRNAKNITSLELSRMLAEVQGFVSLNNIIFGSLIFGQLSIYTQCVLVGYLPCMLMQIYYLIAFMLNGPYYIKQIVGCSSYDSQLLKVKSNQYFAEFYFTNFNKENALEFLNNFVIMNPQCQYSIRIKNELDNTIDSLYHFQSLIFHVVNEFQIYAHSLEMMKFLLDAFYISDYMADNINIVLHYYGFYKQFSEPEVDRILISYDKYQVQCKVRAKYIITPSQFLLEYYRYKISIMLNQIVFSRKCSQHFTINPYQLFYDLYDDLA